MKAAVAFSAVVALGACSSAVSRESGTDVTESDTIGSSSSNSGTTSTTTSTSSPTSTTTTTTATGSTGGSESTGEGSSGSTGGECAGGCDPGELLWQSTELGQSFIADMKAMPDDSIILCASSVDDLTIAGTAVGGNGNSDLYAARMQPDGSFDWALGLGGLDTEFCVSIDANPTGRVAIAGMYFGVGIIDGTALPDVGNDIAMFATIVDMDDGSIETLQSGHAPPDTATFQVQGPVAINGSDDILAAGTFQVEGVFAGNMYTSNGGQDILFSRSDFDDSGQIQIGGNGDEFARGVVFSLGGVYLSGHFDQTLELGGTIPAVDGIEAFFSRTDEFAQSVSWTTISDAAGNETVMWSDVDAAGNLYVAGSFTQDVHLQGLATTESAVELEDVWIAKIASNGTPQWLRAFGGLGPDQPRTLAVSDDGEVVVTGEFSASIDFGGDELTLIGGERDAFVVKLDTDGQHLWSHAGGGEAIDRGLGVEILSDGTVFAAFSVFDDADFGLGTIAVPGDNQSVLIKYAP